MTTHVPVEPFLPGEYIKDEIEARGWTQDDLAEVMGITRRQVINLMTGKSGITPDTAHRLADAFGQDAQTWMNLQVSYELAKAAKEDRDVARRSILFNKVPIREMKRRGWVKRNDTEGLESEVCDFLEIPNIDDAPRIAVAARKGTPSNNPAHLAWYFAVRHMGRRVSAAKFDDKTFEQRLPELRNLAAYPEDVRRVPKALADLGVRLVFVQHLQKTRIDGVAMWLDKRTPVVGLSLRLDKIDNFWFSLFHELVHIKYRHESPVDTDIASSDPGELDDMETIANEEAAAYLIEPAKMSSFIARHSPLYYQKKVVQFAQARGVHPAIVVGQLKHRKELPQTHLNKLHANIRDSLIGSGLTDGWGHTPLATGD